jgi:hypothetical protein
MGVPSVQQIPNGAGEPKIGVSQLSLNLKRRRIGCQVPHSDVRELIAGSVRHWFVWRWCARQCAVVYCPATAIFACSSLPQVGYCSEAEDSIGRVLRKQNKLEVTLGKNCTKPKWMRARTYEQGWANIPEVEERKTHAFYLGALNLCSASGVARDEP